MLLADVQRDLNYSLQAQVNPIIARIMVQTIYEHSQLRFLFNLVGMVAFRRRKWLFSIGKIKKFGEKKGTYFQI